MSPKVSVVIATKNREDLLPSSIHSVLNQTMGDLELIVVDDGSTDGTKELVESYSDSRVRYATTGTVSRGISAARNVGTECATGDWIAVHDDDDFMMPDRLERQLACADGDVDFVYGAFVNFDDDSGELQLHHGRNYSYGAALSTGFAPGHSTWLVKTSIMKEFPYDEGLESAVDNNLAFRLLRAGIVFKHCGEIVLLRRVHNRRITSTGGSKQKYAAELNLQFLRSRLTEEGIKRLWKNARYDWGKLDKTSWQTRILPYLPDHLVRRGGILLAPEIGVDDVIEFVDATDMRWEELYRYLKKGASIKHLTTRYREADCVEAKLDAPSSSGVVFESNLIADYFASICEAAGKVVVYRILRPSEEGIVGLADIQLFKSGGEVTRVEYELFDTVDLFLEKARKIGRSPSELTLFRPSNLLEG